MEQGSYDIEAQVEAQHWWFCGRRQLFASELRALNARIDAKFLDIGTGTGSNLRMLRQEGYRNVIGIDLDPLALRYCVTKGFKSLLLAEATNLPFADGQFDVVLATDTVEHIEDDESALHEIYRVLAPGGHVMISVPAFSSLWGLQDDVAHHKRRYRLPDLIQKMRSSGLQIRRSYYFNFILFVPIWLVRQFNRIVGIKLASENQINSTVLNQLLLRIFSLDIQVAPVLRPPFGVSIMILGQKTLHV
jgi:SAM-dependent methyltransferase